MTKQAIIICGPTASGKTGYAHNIAKKRYGQIINADSMQIYKQIPRVTASPAEEFKKEIPYHLYNFLDIEEDFSAVKYSEIAAKKIREIDNAGSMPIIVGGTGLYINALVYGYNKIPGISKEIRDETRNLYNKIGPEEFWQKLIAIDPLAVNKLKQYDKQRILRAYEVKLQTKRSIFSFIEDDKFIPLPDFKFRILALLPERNKLYDNCNQRVKVNIDFWIEEIKAIKDRLILCQASSRKALGIPEILSYLDNKLSYHDMIEQVSMQTRRYAKRQITWFKNQLPNTEIIHDSTTPL